jgi:hypothetical protein
MALDELDNDIAPASTADVLADFAKVSSQDAWQKFETRNAKTESVKESYFSPPQSGADDRLAASRVTDPRGVSAEELKAQNGRLEKASSELQDVKDELKKGEFPALALAAVMLGLAKEQHVNAQLKGHVDGINKRQKDMQLLLDLNAQLMPLKEANNELPATAKAILSELKARGIDLWKKEGTSLKKEEVADLRSLSGSKIDQLRSEVQVTLSAHMQALVQSIGAILECIKGIIQYNNRLISAANQLKH